jgi:hypothetical protein
MVRKAESWEIPKTAEQAEWFWRGRRYYDWYSEICSFPVGKKRDHQCCNRPGYGPDELYCKQHAKIIQKGNFPDL